MDKKNAMTPIDLTHLKEFEREWVALPEDRKVVDHSLELVALRKRLGDAQGKYRYVFVPPSSMGFSGPCPT